MMMWRPFAFSLALFFVAHQSRASGNYPAVIREVVPTNHAVRCTLCHALADGGNGAVATVFARHMQDFGMKGDDPSSLRRALRRNAARGWDSDGDGVPDIEELVYGSDPSSLALSDSETVMHGCAVGHTGTRWHLVPLFFALVAWARRRKRQRPPCHTPLAR